MIVESRRVGSGPRWATVSGSDQSGTAVSDDDDARVEVRRGEGLPITGGDVWRIILLGLLLVATGVAIRSALRARRHARHLPTPGVDTAGGQPG